MPCVMSAHEIASAERELNEEELGMSVTDETAAIEAACQACKLLRSGKGLKDASPFLKAWWKKHQKFDLGRKKKRKAKEGRRKGRRSF